MTWVASRLSRSMRRLTLAAVASAAAAALVVPSALATPESDAVDAINQAWNAAGGPDSVVGNPDGEVFGVGDGFGQKFTGGKIFFAPSAGAHLIYGAVLDKYESLGGPADSDLGFPNIDTVAGLVSAKSRVSTFNATDKPAIFWTPDTGAWAVRGALNVAWDKLGGSAGQLGVPVEDERYDGDVVSQKFTGGQLSWNFKTNTFTSDPAGLADSLAGLEVPLDPTTMINLAWRAGGGLGGPLGARQGEQNKISDNAAAQGYVGGKIFYSPDTGAHAVTGAILSKYESLGGPTGDLGFPVGAEADGGVPNSRVSSFSAPDKPAIFWTPDTGAVVVRGPINAAWAKLGGATGTLGVPTEEQTSNGDTVSQTFTGGELSWNKATKEFSSKPAELASQLSGLEMPDAVTQTPAAPPSGGTGSAGGGSHWWWLAILVPLLLLLGLMAVLAQRKGRADRPAEQRDFFGSDAAEDHWPGPGVSRYGTESGKDLHAWSPATAEEGHGGFDEDEITAPTRVPGEAELAQPEDDWGVPGSLAGRHSASALGDSGAAWRLELDEIIATSRRRHAVEDTWIEEIAPVVDEEGPQERFEVEMEPEHVDEPESGVEAGVEGPSDSADEESVDEPWRPAIHLPLADPFQAPEGYTIKGNTHSGLYYTEESALYENTIPEVWFASEELAQANGFVKAPE